LKDDELQLEKKQNQNQKINLQSNKNTWLNEFEPTVSLNN
jgi:hypothetical protein